MNNSGGIECPGTNRVETKTLGVGEVNRKLRLISMK